MPKIAKLADKEPEHWCDTRTMLVEARKQRDAAIARAELAEGRLDEIAVWLGSWLRDLSDTYQHAGRLVKEASGQHVRIGIDNSKKPGPKAAKGDPTPLSQGRKGATHPAKPATAAKAPKAGPGDTSQPDPQVGDVWEARGGKHRRILIYGIHSYAHRGAKGSKVIATVYDEGPDEGREIRMSSRVLQRGWVVVGVAALAAAATRPAPKGKKR